MNFRNTGACLLLVLAACLLVFFLTPFGSTKAAGDRKGKGKLNTSNVRRPGNFDALAERPQAADLTRPENKAVKRMQTEPRFNVPTFLWASEPGPATQLRGDAVQKKDEQIAAARAHLGRYADQYRLKKIDLLAARVASIHDTGSGAIIVKLRQDLGGVEVFRDEVNVIMNRELQLVAISGYLTGDHANDSAASASFKLQPAEALSTALSDLTGTTVDTTRLQQLNSVAVRKSPETADPYTRFGAEKDSFSGFTFSDEPSRTKPVMFHLPEGYVPAFYVETSIIVSSARADRADLSGENPVEELAYSYVISAVDGQVLFRKNLIAEQSYSYRVWADPSTKIPFDTPAGNNVHPKIDAVPNGVQYPFAAQQDVSLVSSPFSRNDPWLPAGATETSGNNADAFVDLTTPDGYGPVAAVPYDGAGSGDYRAQITSAGAFLHSHVADSNPATAEARQGAIQQLFYNVNFLHDWFYDSGFDEASGNAQTDNYGRGGLASDNMKAQAQDFAARNNANMLTPADGGRPRMRMYLFDSNSVRYLDVLSPASIAGQRAVGTGQFGAQVFDMTQTVVQPAPADGCTAASFAGTAGKFVMVDREPTATCSIGTKLNNAMAAGAAGFILVNLSTTPDTLVNVTGSLPTFTIPFVSITWNGAAGIKTQLAAAATVTARLRRDAGVDRDGTIDNQIVSHEWGHYISNRLIGNAAGLNTNMSGGLGEGWGDFTAMLLTVRSDDTSTASNATWNGAYALATYATSGGANNGYYFGIRRVPYSTDLNVDPLTFRHIANGQAIPAGPPIAFGADGSNNAEVHNIGEVWSTMLWECYASLLRDTQGASPRLTFAQAQTRMKNYLVAAYKMTPNSPTLIEARDAVLAAASTNDPVDGALFGQAFAKRGAGLRAIAPDRFSTTNVGVTESYAVGGDISYVQSTLDDSIYSVDHDGYLDIGETGLLKVTLRNSGVSTISATTSQISSNNSGLTFPSGTTINFPAVGPGATATASVVVHCGLQVGIQKPEFTITSNDPGIAGDSESLIPSPVVSVYSAYVNVDEVLNSSATDDVEANQTLWAASSNPGLSQAAGSKFRRTAQVPLNYMWFVPDYSIGSDQYLTSPSFTVDGSGSFNVTFLHRWGFEFDGGGNYDGGVVEMSVNGGAFTDIGASAYNGTIASYTGNVNPLAGRPAFVQNSAPSVRTSLTQAVAPGSTVRVRFRAASDSTVGGTGWFIDTIEFSGVVGTPFATLIADLAPTAAPVSVEGRVASASGRNLSKAVVTITDGQGFTRSTLTSSFGYYRFDAVPVGTTYIVQASAKGYTFAPQAVSVTDNLTGLDFVAGQ